jgi:hypothetical protein
MTSCRITLQCFVVGVRLSVDTLPVLDTVRPCQRCRCRVETYLSVDCVTLLNPKTFCIMRQEDFICIYAVNEHQSAKNIDRVGINPGVTW